MLARSQHVITPNIGEEMIDCKELTGKVVRTLRVYEPSVEAAEICIEFTDGTFFTTRLSVATAIDAKISSNEAEGFAVLRNYTPSTSPSGS